jgi:ribonucleotide reductase alpha subunit
MSDKKKINTDTVFESPFSEEIWTATYKDYNDVTIDDTMHRVARFVASAESTEELQKRWEEEFYALLSGFKATAGGRIYANAGTEWGGTTLMNCFVAPRGDCDIDSLPNIIHDVLNQAQTLKSEGGWGQNFSWIRPRGAFIHGIGVESPGAIKYMEIYDTVSDVITAGAGKKSLHHKAKGKIRKGAMMGVLDCWHPDIAEFVTSKQQPGRLTKFNVSVNCTDEFMDRIVKILNLKQQEQTKEVQNAIQVYDRWNLRFPDTTFEKYTDEWDGNIKKWESKEYPVKIYNTVSAMWLWNLIMESCYNRAEPGVLFLDRANYFGPLNYAENISATNPCLSGETLVAVADGRHNVSIQQLAEEGKDVPVFCYDEDGKIVIKTMRHPRVTGHDEDVYRIIFDDGTSIICTPTHKFMLTNGEYKEVQNLCTGDSLRTMNKFHASFDDMFSNIDSPSQDYVWLNSGKQNSLEHRLIAEHYNNSKIPSNYIVHHIDFDSLNNIPKNLKIMSKKEHDEYHSSLIRGDNNPMRRAKREWTDEQWLNYKGVSSPSYDTSGENNSRYCGITNAEIFQHALTLTKRLDRRFSVNEWEQYAKENNLISQFSAWRSAHLHGGVRGMALFAAIELGHDPVFASLNTRTQRLYKNLVKYGYDVIVENKQLYVNKNCEVCKKYFKIHSHRREASICSVECASEYTRKRNIENKDTYSILSKKAIDAIKMDNRERQAQIYNDLKFKLNRDVLKREWKTECKHQEIPLSIGPKSPFRTYDELKEYANNMNHRVVNVEFAGKRTVYNGTVDDTHNFFVGGYKSETSKGKLKFTYFNNLQCGEQVLAPGGVCNLGSINLTQFVKEDGTGFDLNSIKNTTQCLTRFLDNINSLSNAPLIEYTDSMRNKRRIGIGILGWGSALLMLKVRFGSEKASELRENVMRTIARTAYIASIDLAEEKGMFKYCDPQKHAEGAFIKSLDLPSEYMNKLRQVGIRNSSLLSIQPTGNTSIFANVVSGGLEPIFMPEYIRTVVVNEMPEEFADVCPKWFEGEWHETEMFKYDKEGDEEILKGKHNGVVYKIDKNRGLTKEVLCEDYGVRYLKEKDAWDPNADFSVTTANLSVDDHVNDLKGFARWIDSATSKTINIPFDYPFEDFKNIYLNAYQSGYIKGVTTYRAGTMTTVLAAKDERDADEYDEEIIEEDVKVPVQAPATVNIIRADGKKWYLTTVWNEQKTRPMAFFVHTNHHETSVHTVDAIDRLLKLAKDKKIPEKWIEDTSKKMEKDNNATKIARAISLNLRHGVLIKNVVFTLDRVPNVFVNSFLFQIRKYLSTFIKDGEKVEGEKCQECGSENVIYSEGCKKCMSCGSSKCG